MHRLGDLLHRLLGQWLPALRREEAEESGETHGYWSRAPLHGCVFPGNCLAQWVDRSISLLHPFFQVVDLGGLHFF